MLKLGESLSKARFLITISVFILPIFFTIYSVPHSSGDLTNPSLLTPHNPIVIDGNTQFISANGVVKGTGTKSNPYIIENWKINATNDIGIKIMNTDAYFIIRNCYIYDGKNGSSPNDGIYFDYVSNGTVENNRLINNRLGIIIVANWYYKSFYNTIFNNTCNYNDCGIEFKGYCDWNIISNNNCNYNTISGIFVGGHDKGYDRCNNNIISNNSCNWNNWYGIYFYGYYNKLINNTCNLNNRNGIIFDGDENAILNNKCNLNKNSGILIKDFSNTISNNSFIKNNYGLYLQGAFNKITGNIVINNTCGIQIYGTLKNRIFNNIFDNNRNYDIGGSKNFNIWNQTKELGINIVGGPYLGGNFWSNYTGVDIDGDGLGDTKLPYGLGDFHPLIDRYPPKIIDKTTGNPTTGDQFIFNAMIVDFVNVKTAHINYWFDQSPTRNETMNRIYTNSSDSNYYLTISVPDYAFKLNYRMSACDLNSNWNQTLLRVLDVIDNDAPVILDYTSSFPTTDENFAINVSVMDNIKVSNAYLEYWFDDHSQENKTLSSNGINYNDEIIAPANAKTLSYILSAVDNSSNWASLNLTILDVIDNDPPLIIDESGTPTTGDKFNFNFKITDNIDLSITYLEYWFDDNSHINITLPEDGSYQITVPQNAYALYGVITAIDTSNNIGQLEISKQVIDNDSPIIDDITKGLPETGFTFTIKCKVTDNHAINNVKIEYWFDYNNPSLANMNLENNDIYSLEVNVPETSRTQYYRITGIDVSNNSAQISNNLPVIDVIPPEINDRTKGLPITGDLFEIKASVIDNIAVKSIYLEYWFDDNFAARINQSFDGNHSIIVPNNAKKLDYIIFAMDTNNNSAKENKSLMVIDIIPPKIYDLTKGLPTTGDEFEIKAYAEDNIGVDLIYLEYWFDESKHFENVFDETQLMIIPDNAMELHYIIIAVDFNDNMASIKRTLKVIDNDRPIITDFSAISEDGFKFSAKVEDNIKVDKVFVNYWFDNGNRYNLTLNLVNNRYEALISINENAYKLHYIISAVDTSMNWNISEIYEIILSEPEQEIQEKSSEEWSFWIVYIIILIIVILISIIGIFMFHKRKKNLSNKPQVVSENIEPDCSPTTTEQPQLATPVNPTPTISKSATLQTPQLQTPQVTSKPQLPGTTPTIQETETQQIPQLPSEEPQYKEGNMAETSQGSTEETTTPINPQEP